MLDVGIEGQKAVFQGHPFDYASDTVLPNLLYFQIWRKEAALGQALEQGITGFTSIISLDVVLNRCETGQGQWGHV